MPITSARPASSSRTGATTRLEVVELVLAHVDDRHHRPVGEEEVRLQQPAVAVLEVGAVDRRAGLEDRLGLLERRHLVDERLVALGRLAALLDLVLDRLEVGVGELELDDAEVLERIGRARDVVVGEGPQHEDDGVGLADVAEELVAEALALARAGDQAADVDELHGGGHHVAALAHRGEGVEAGVGDAGHADVRVRGGEGVRRGQRAATGQRVVQRRLPRVGETDEPEPLHRARQGTGAPVRRANRARFLAR